ncbi:MAG TPA: alpha/beta hydrolase-fold protein [Nocardioidaceae bacterium]|jgi:esterase/lipase superfamily enzyme
MSELKATEQWYSDRMKQAMSLARWGSYGVPVLVFPTAGGDAEEVERHHLVGHLWPLVEAGRVKVYSCDSVAGAAMAKGDGSADYRCWLFNQFQQAVANEVVPAIHADSAGPHDVIVAGASIGAFNALAMISRFPQLFRAAICMSGTYNLERMVGGFTEDLFFSSPIHFLPGLDGPILDLLRQRFVYIASGSGAWEDVGESWRVAEVLGAKGVPNRVDDWGPEYEHDWPTWWQMLPTYVEQAL